MSSIVYATTSPTRYVATENYDLAGVLLLLANGNVLNVWAAGSNQSTSDFVIAMRQSADNGATWTPYAGTVYGGGTNPNSISGVFYTKLGTANISATSITTANRLDVTTNAQAKVYAVGATVVLAGTAESFLNGNTVTVLASPAPTTTSFSANFTHANFTNASDTGTAYGAITADFAESANCTAMLTSTGAIILFWQIDTGIAGAFNFLGFYSRSTDNGATWSAPAALPAGLGVPTNGSVIVVPNGGVCPLYPSGLLAVPVLKSDTSGTVLISSSDDGQTWSTLLTVGNLGATEECSISWIGGNQLLGFCRNATGTVAGTKPLLFLYSSNMGATWTITNSNIDLTQTTPSGSSGLFSYTMIAPWIINPTPGGTGGQLTVLFAERSSWNGISPSAYTSFRAITFTPGPVISNPLSFPVGQVLDSATSSSSVDAGYPSAVLVSPNKYLMQWMKNKIGGCFSCAAMWTFYATYFSGDALASGGVNFNGGASLV